MYTDEEMETEMGLLLRAGVIAACLVMIVGGALYLLRHGHEHETWAVFHGVPAPFESIRGIVSEVRAGTARGIIQLGVLIMIATPIMRVAFAVYGFSRQKQWLFSLISAVVLCVLAFGLSTS